MKISCYSAVLILIFLQSGCSSEVDKHTNHAAYYQLTTEKTLEEVLDDTIFAITERNFRITGHLHIGKGIRDRKNPDFPDYEVLLYCNLVYAKKMLELDPEMLNSCPGRITVRQNNEKVVITALLWPVDMKNEELKLHMQEMNILVREIVDYAADDWLLVYDKETAATE
ncbi:MAG: DUF302 domain-containing protein [Gammaproteobacteria bacterium]|nr:MAG: DUF302 domain-containing protein [Gammaproteobacteria bacterium]RKZ71632.1 MAG: DUF302 domain-containing protein [Gammaproteobacteria bacterium]